MTNSQETPDSLLRWNAGGSITIPEECHLAEPSLNLKRYVTAHEQMWYIDGHIEL